MNEKFSSITIQAKTEVVFRALTDPQLIKQWQFGKELRTDWKQAHEITFLSEMNGKKTLQRGTVLIFKENQKISYTLNTPSAAGDIQSITTYSLFSEKENTRVEIQQSDNRPSSFQPPDLLPVLNALKSVAENL